MFYNWFLSLSAGRRKEGVKRKKKVLIMIIWVYYEMSIFRRAAHV